MVPGEFSATYLLQQLLPSDAYMLEPPCRDLWHLSELDLPPPSAPGLGTGAAPQVPLDPAGHALHALQVPRAGYRCSACARELEEGAAMRGCADCLYFLCASCYLSALKSGGGRPSINELAPLPLDEARRAKAKASDEARLTQLRRFAAVGRFDLSPLLHFGQLRCLKTDAPQVKRLCRRDGQGQLLPLADPHDYYARAAILHHLVPVSATAAQRQQVLHEAREALLAAVAGDGANALATQQFSFAKARNPLGAERDPKSRSGLPDPRDPRSRAEKAATDPRIWYLLGLVLGDLGVFSEARHVYRQTLSRLPVACFGHVVHFNLACILARQPGEAARAQALRELKEFRRVCRSLGRHAIGGPRPNVAPCELCGAIPCR